MSGAEFSDDRKYRRLLWRQWDPSAPWLCMIMLNPSAAGEVKNDPTVQRQIERAKRLGFGGLMVVNAYDLVSTDPMVLKDHPCPNTADNDDAIILASQRTLVTGGKIIAGWGKHASPERSRAICVKLRTVGAWPIYSLGINCDGSPVHPLYKAYDTPLVEWPSGQKNGED
jgi:hypothetical protein